MVELSQENLDSITNAVKEGLSSSPDSATMLGTVSDVWVLIALIIPGFIMVKIITWFISNETDFGQFLLTLYSLMGSLGLIVIFSLIPLDDVDMSSIENIRIHVVNPSVISILFGLAVLFGVTAGIILKLTIFQQHFAGTAWNRFAKDHLGEWVKLYSKDPSNTPKVYVGYIKRISTGNNDKQDLSLGQPQIFVKDAQNIYSLKDLGEELYFTASTILQIEKLNSDD